MITISCNLNEAMPTAVRRRVLVITYYILYPSIGNPGEIIKRNAHK